MIETSAAVCCWCGKSLKRTGEDAPWMCWTDACARRQREWGLALPEVDKRGKPTGRIKRYLYMPTPRQTEFHEMTLRHQRVLYGGAAGGAKSHALRWGLYRECLRTGNMNCLLLRRTYPELESTHLRMMAREAPLLGANYGKAERQVRFDNGSVIEAGHCATSDDAARYLSAEYDIVAFDELVTFDRDAALEIMSRARTSKPDVVKRGGAQIWAGTNPGGRGAAWVKGLFVDREVDPQEFPNYDPSRYGYVPARLDDNPYMDPGYRKSLEEMRETRKRQLLYGDWDVFDGQFFDWYASREGRPWHVKDLGLRSGDIANLPLGGGLDWGSASPGNFGLYAALGDGRLHKLDEVKFNGPGERLTVRLVAERIVAKCADWGLAKVPSTGADPSIQPAALNGQVGEGIGATFWRYKVPCYYVSNDRLNGWQRVHEALASHPDGNGPWFTVHPRCHYTIRTLPLMVQSDKDPEDVDTNSDDHAADETRYALQRIWNPRRKKEAVTQYAPNTWGFWRQYHQKQDRGSGVLA